MFQVLVDCRVVHLVPGTWNFPSVALLIQVPGRATLVHLDERTPEHQNGPVYIPLVSHLIRTHCGQMSASYVLLQFGADFSAMRFEDLEGRLAFTLSVSFSSSRLRFY